MNSFNLLLLTLHNLWRWVVLIMAIIAVVTGFIGWLGRRPWTERDRRIGSLTAMSMDVQFLLGLLLYIFGAYGIKVLGQLRSSSQNLFFGVEHVVLMVLALAFAHLGNILPRRVEDPTAKFIRAAILFSLMLVVILIGIPWWRPLLRVFGFQIP
jgi:uncharacterized membrane protein